MQVAGYRLYVVSGSYVGNGGDVAIGEDGRVGFGRWELVLCSRSVVRDSAVVNWCCVL